MNIKNLKRAAEIEKELPELEAARKMLSAQGSFIRVHDSNKSYVDLPHSLNYNLASAVNVEINKLKEEVAKL